MNDNDKGMQVYAPSASVMLYEPDVVISQGTKAAQALMGVVEAKHLYHEIGKKKHLEYEAWQIIGAFHGCTAIVDWAKPIMAAGAIVGYEARASVTNPQGRIIASAESDCRTEEQNWTGKPLFQVKSMAETRAASKALRMAFAWVAVLGGYSPTPAEEMISEHQNRQTEQAKPQAPMGFCPKCNTELRTGISKKNNERWWRCPKCDEFVNDPIMGPRADAADELIDADPEPPSDLERELAAKTAELRAAPSEADRGLQLVRSKWKGSDREWMGFLQETIGLVTKGTLKWASLPEEQKKQVGKALLERLAQEPA